MSRFRWVLGAGLVLVLVGAYYGGVRPLRVAFSESVAYPLFAQGEAVRSGAVDLERRASYVSASGPGVDERSGADVALYKTPLGDRPMIGVLLLAFLYPRRRWWLVLAATALAEGVFTTVFFAAGTDGVEGAFVAHRVVQAVLNDTLPLAFPALVFLLDRAGVLAESDPAPATPSTSSR